MTYSVLLPGATGFIGHKIALQLADHKQSLGRAAFLTPRANGGQEKEDKYAKVPLERIVGTLEDKSSYEGISPIFQPIMSAPNCQSGFDIVISAVGDALCMNQPKYMDAAFAGGVKHFYPAECKCAHHKQHHR